MPFSVFYASSCVPFFMKQSQFVLFLFVLPINSPHKSYIHTATFTHHSFQQHVFPSLSVLSIVYATREKKNKTKKQRNKSENVNIYQGGYMAKKKEKKKRKKVKERYVP
jgi:hypothetical protein